MKLQDHLFSVSELNQVIKNVLEDSFYSIILEGELSNFRPAASGHWYFSLKDRDSSISGVMFKNSAYGVNFNPKDGDKVKVKGKLTLYSQRGTYQIVCSSLTLFGEGDILLMLEERKRKLASLGLFDPSKKQKLPKIPKTIGIITSPTGAALQDILKVLRRRHTLSNILILPTLVQGNSAGITISKQIKKVNRDNLCDLIILSRGGGSVEDLLCFSEENVIYAINESKIPIITGIGHEIDTSLSDLASDFRAATPSAAAEIATEGTEQLFQMLASLKRDLIQNMKYKLSDIRTRVNGFSKNYAIRVLRSKIENRMLSVDNLKRELRSNMAWQLNRDKTRIFNSKTNLESLSPYSLFNKGYAWVSKNGENISGQQIKSGDTINIRYKDGDITGEVLGE